MISVASCCLYSVAVLNLDFFPLSKECHCSLSKSTMKLHSIWTYATSFLYVFFFFFEKLDFLTLPNFKKIFTLKTSCAYKMYLHSLVLGLCKHLQCICFAVWHSLLSLTHWVQSVLSICAGCWGVGAFHGQPTSGQPWRVTLLPQQPSTASTAPLRLALRCSSALHTSTFHLRDLMQVTAVLAVHVCEMSC